MKIVRLNIRTFDICHRHRIYVKACSQQLGIRFRIGEWVFLRLTWSPKFFSMSTFQFRHQIGQEWNSVRTVLHSGVQKFKKHISIIIILHFIYSRR